MKNTSKILALVLVVMTVLMSLSAITASAATETVTMVFEAKDMVGVLEVNAENTAIINAGTDNFFTINMSKSKLQTESKSFEDGYTPEYRFSLNGNSKISGGALQRSFGFTVPAAASIKVWWKCGGAGRTIELYGSDLTEITEVGADSAKDALYISTFTVDAAGTYYIAHSGGTNYICKIVVSWEVETCSHEGGTATCKDLAVCTKCGASYGELSTEHNFVNGTCSVCGAADPNACQHTNMAPATCLLPSTCECGYTVGEALGHNIIVDEAKAPTCTEKGLEAGEHCTRCDHVVAQKEVAALGHTLTFVNTLPVPGTAGSVKAHCSVCNVDIDYGTFNVMTPGTYVLDAKELADISATGQAYDGQVRIVGDVFACHLSVKYRTDANVKTFAADDWTSTHRMNFGGASGFCNNGEGEEAVRNGGLRNYIQIVTTEETTITFHWVIGGDDRELGVFDMNGELVAVTEEKGKKNDVVVSTLTVPAGSYLVGSAASDGGSYIFKMTVDVTAPHTHVWSDATCTEPAKCECGETQGEALGHDLATHTETLPTCTETGLTAGEECTRCGHKTGMEEIPALGHDYNEGQCTRCGEKDPTWVPPHEHKFVDGKCECGEKDPDYVAPQPQPQPEPNFFQKIIAWFMELINKLLAIFKK